jgi:hypothetical protein
MEKMKDHVKALSGRKITVLDIVGDGTAITLIVVTGDPSKYEIITEIGEDCFEVRSLIRENNRIGLENITVYSIESVKKIRLL